MSRSRDTTTEFAVAPKDAGTEPCHGVLTVLSHQCPGRAIPLGHEPVTVGRDAEAAVQIEDESLSRVHARFAALHGSFFVQDLDSTNGTFVEGERVCGSVPLHDGMRVQLGRDTVMRFRLQDDQELEATRRLYEQSVRDGLTGAYNRHHLEERLRGDIAYSKRHGTPLTVLFVDVDHFKRVNDTYGHAAGDEVLRRISDLLAEMVRTEDLVARFGGEEFVVLARGVAAKGGAALAERIRAAVEALSVSADGVSIEVTVSIGLAALDPTSDTTREQLLARADTALYRAKREGRNSVQQG